MRYFIILALFCLVGWASSRKCPAKYRRFSPQHSLCLPPNPTCKIMRKGVTPEDKEYILRLHNQFRSKTAMGNEDRAKDGTLPQAADMMQMEWDNGLAAVAQKWTENCKYEHDCKECKAVEDFAVGQNLFLQSPHCSGAICDGLPEKADWTRAITALYDEVLDYHVNWLDSFKKRSGPKTGHLTQLIWSRSWRVGCGYSFYKLGNGYQYFYACNYGVGGNMKGEPVYKQGPPCSACPTNTQCSTSSSGPNTYPGLCKLNNPKIAPISSKDEKGLLFSCFATHGDPDCQARTSGAWKIKRSVGGNYYTIVLSGGQSASITFTNPIKPHGDAFCLALYFRKGPLDASTGDVSSFQANFQMEGATVPPKELRSGSTSFKNVYVGFGWGSESKLGFTFSVPSGAGKHVVDIRKIAAYDGPCP